MNKKFILILLTVLMAQSAVRSPQSFAASWEDEKKTWEEYANSKQEKDPGYAAKLSISFLPIDNGHFYTGDVGKGIWFSVGETACLAAAAVSFLGAQSRAKQEIKPQWTDAMVAAAAVGGIGYIGLKVWAAYDAAASARRYNEAQKAKREQGARLDFHPNGVILSKQF